MNIDDLLQLARDRGYHQNMRSADKTWIGLHHERHQIHLELYPLTGEFCLMSFKGVFKITTDKCGSFENDEHFLRLQRQLIEIDDRLAI